ncbi:MAG: ABC transporter permease [Pseudomonadota bacterium]|nr:ABC transporter permease [Pseudomonadota bacterium]
MSVSADTEYWTIDAAGAAILPRGRWTIAEAGRIDAALARLSVRGSGIRRIALDRLERVDTAGAWMICKLARRCDLDVATSVECPDPGKLNLILRVEAAHAEPADMPVPGNPVLRVLERLGKATVDSLERAGSIIGFLGQTVAIGASVLVRPRRMRLTSMVHHMEQAGLNALPIVGLIAFLIGIVLAFQGASQLERFGAQIFVVNLIGISILREIGILLTAIVVAGRSGSAFAAQLGAMKINEEIDALRTLGLDPMVVLVLPRVLALTLMMPVLAFFADMAGLVGGGLMAWVALGVSPEVYVDRLSTAVSINALMVGLVKAPVFGALIALIGCYEGLQTGGSSDSLGRQTTMAVVEGIFIVIVADAAFSIFFNVVGI